MKNISFREHLNEEAEFNEILNEKLIILGKGAKMGQIVFLAGGAGSGKGFAISNFLEKNKYKVRDVDEWKKALIEMDKLGKIDFEKKIGKRANGKQLKDFDLRKPKDVFELHDITKELGIKSKTLDLLLTDLKKDRLPNILFDMTLKDVSDITDILPRLIGLGYEPVNVHLVWVLTKYSVAVANNADRERVVPADILLQTHEGASKSMVKLTTGETNAVVNSRGLWGDIHIILNNKENTIWFTDKDTKDTIKNQTQEGGKKRGVVKHFLSLQMKKAGKPIFAAPIIKKQMFDWIKDNIPPSNATKDLF